MSEAVQLAIVELVKGLGTVLIISLVFKKPITKLIDGITNLEFFHKGKDGEETSLSIAKNIAKEIVENSLQLKANTDPNFQLKYDQGIVSILKAEDIPTVVNSASTTVKAFEAHFNHLWGEHCQEEETKGEQHGRLCENPSAH